MNTKMKIAFSSYFIALLLLASFGIIYLFSPKFMPYHAEAVRMNWSSVDAGFQVLILALMKSYGAATIGMVLSLGALLIKPFREGQYWVKYVIPAICLIFTIPALYVTLYVRAKTSAATPWIAVVVGMILVAIGFVFSIYSENHKVPQVD